VGTLANATITRFPRQGRIRTSQGGERKRHRDPWRGKRDREIARRKRIHFFEDASLKRTSRANGPGEMTKNRENIADWKPDYLPLLVTVISELKRAPWASILSVVFLSFFRSFFFSANTSKSLSPSIREKEADCVDFCDYRDTRRGIRRREKLAKSFTGWPLWLYERS